MEAQRSRLCEQNQLVLDAQHIAHNAATEYAVHCARSAALAERVEVIAEDNAERETVNQEAVESQVCARMRASRASFVSVCLCICVSNHTLSPFLSRTCVTPVVTTGAHDRPCGRPCGTRGVMSHA